MTAGDLLHFAARALTGHRLRSGLSLLGIAIGVAAVVVLTALGNGARRYVTDQFTSLGTNMLIVLPGHTETTGAMPGVTGVPNDLTLDDALAVARSIPSVHRVAPITVNTETVAYGERRRQVAIIGTTRDYQAIRGLRLARGTFLPQQELQRGSAVTVLGWTTARELFAGEDPVGAVLRVGDARMRVIGVLAPSGTQVGVNLDEIALIPVGSAMRIFNRSSLFRLIAQTWSHEDLVRAQQQVTRLLVDRHGEEDFTSIRQDSVVSGLSAILRALTLALTAIAAVSLAVAGIGIMNVMLVSVSERTREIGLLKALGAGRQQILRAFLAEATLLAASGGLLGLALGWLSVGLLVHLYPALPASPPAWAVAAALAVSVLVGVVFGVLPARRASQLDPIAALNRR